MQRKSGLLIVHMGTPQDKIAYKYGNVSVGFAKLRYVIDNASQKEVPIVFLELDDYWPLPRELTDGVGNFNKLEIPSVNGFDCPYSPVALKDVLNTFSITDLVIGGYNKTVCVEKTAKGAVENGFRLHTSDEILFQHLDTNAKSNEETLANLRKIGTVYDTAQELVKAVFEDLQNHSASK